LTHPSSHSSLQAFAFASTSCPEFTSTDPSLRSKQYSPADLRFIVKTAANLGIRVIPELDIPGHAAGFRFGNSGYIASCPAYIAQYKHWGIPLNPSHPLLMAVIKPFFYN
jgi:hexosaminidase